MLLTDAIGSITSGAVVARRSYTRPSTSMIQTCECRGFDPHLVKLRVKFSTSFLSSSRPFQR